jgi:hypothetical protein
MARRDVRGFTVVEVLVALATAAMTLAAIANLAHSAALSGVHTARRLGEVALAQSLLSQFADRDLNGEPQVGEAAGGLRWDVAIAPWSGDRAAGGWTPVIVRFDVREGGGAEWSVEAIRLVKADKK